MIRWIVSFSCCFLAGCGIFSDSQDDNPLLNKTMMLDSPRFLSVTRYSTWLNTMMDINTLELPSKATCMEGTDCLPTLKQYFENRSYWQSWHTRKKTQYRIIGLLPAKTQFHFYKIIVPEQKETGVYFYYSQIDSGLYKGMQAYYQDYHSVSTQ